MMLVFNELALRWLLGAKGNERPIYEIYSDIWKVILRYEGTEDIMPDGPKIMQLELDDRLWMVDEDELTFVMDHLRGTFADRRSP